MKRWILSAALLAALTGCADDADQGAGVTDTGAGQDTTSADTAGADSTTDGGDTASLDTLDDAGPGDTVASDAGPGDAGPQDAGDAPTPDAGDTAHSCEGVAPLCAPSCGGDVFYGPAICEGGAWVCEEGVLRTDCPPFTCWGEKAPGEICTDQGWACAPDAAAFAECHQTMCLTCAGWTDSPPTAGCACSCEAEHVVCEKVAQACEPTSESGLDGASITIGAIDCTFTLAEAAAGISIPYTVTITEPLGGVIALPQDGGQCDQPGPSGLITFERLAGGDVYYCLCDSGLCQGPDETPKTLSPGSWPGTFSWDGREWFGPSDFGNPKGDPFPPGDYTLTVSAKGKVVTEDSMTPFEVKATVMIHLVP
ncbi:MAG: hypothetical protein AMXMBFR64_46740 [Myxococcales bacterium]